MQFAISAHHAITKNKLFSHSQISQNSTAYQTTSQQIVNTFDEVSIKNAEVLDLFIFL
jgi:hypothetical protein